MTDAPSEPPPVPPVPSELVEFMSGHWGGRPSPVEGPSPAAPFHAARRARIQERFAGDWLVIPTGNLKVRANDTDYRFRAGTDFAWLTGYQDPDGVLVITDAGSTLYMPPRSDRSTPAFFNDRRYGELWVGPRLGLEEVTLLLAIDTAPLGDLAQRLKEAPSIRTVRGFDAVVDAMVDSTDAARSEDADAELLTALADLRQIKDEHELDCLQQAVDATKLGFEDVIRALPDAERHSERWVEGTFNRRARTEGNDVGYDTIAACGHHACTLHWIRNDGPVRAGDLLLLDAGVEGPELYTADVTRTIPVSGRYSPVQREVYETVWRAQQAAFAECRPGRAFLAPHRAAMRVITEWLVDKGFLPYDVEEALDPKRKFHTRFTLHGTSHMLGLDVHDCADARNDYREHDLAPGMVLTVEPGCYFQPDDLSVPAEYRGIGVRIEDDVVITDDGYRNLTEAFPSQADEVEAWMAGLTAQP
jgi:Xaa-Pro aminopeptidase